MVWWLWASLGRSGTGAHGPACASSAASDGCGGLRVLHSGGQGRGGALDGGGILRGRQGTPIGADDNGDGGDEGGDGPGVLGEVDTEGGQAAAVRGEGMPEGAAVARAEGGGQGGLSWVGLRKGQ